jgi:hypothetical protein
MSKKLIAVASAAALAITALVGIAPATASGPALAFSSGTSGGDGSTSALASTVAAPVTNIMSTSFAATTTISGLATGDVVRIEATGAVKLLEDVTNFGAAANANIDVSKAGVATISKTRTSNTSLVVYAYTTSTTAGEVKVSVTRTGLSFNTSLWLKAAAPAAQYNITDVTGVPATLAKGATADITFKATDLFGNAVEDDADVKNVDRVKVDGTSIATAPTWDAAAKVYKATITSPSSSAFIVKVSSGATDIVGAAAAVSSTAVVNNTGVASQITALTAQVTALTADYNALAAKWNKRVASKTAPKKKVVLK